LAPLDVSAKPAAGFRVSVFHNRSISPSDAETTHRPSGEYVMALTGPEAPEKVETGSPLSKSHTMIFLSQDRETTCRPSGE
jgi:hypothetical protein